MVEKVLEEMVRRMAGLSLSAEEIRSLAPQVQGLLARLRKMDDLDLQRVEPAVIFTLPGPFMSPGPLR